MAKNKRTEKPIRSVNATAIFFPPLLLSDVFFIIKNNAAARLPIMRMNAMRTAYFMVRIIA